ncbi:MAG TPA: hypothetical protein VKT82_21580 [Ktedonobacterales bacterium]|nr:hypothetical protein [Ktedonobacterales bacterium]
MSSRQNSRQSAEKSARPPEYVIIRRQGGTPSGQLSQPKKARQGKKETKFDESEARREQRREQRYKAKRRKQWILSLGIIVVFIALLAIALYFLDSRSSNGNNTPTPAAGGQGYHLNASISQA